MVVCGLFVLDLANKFQPETKVITVSEKYAKYQYQSWCGKSTCTSYKDAFIIDTNGDVYTFSNEKLWAKIKPNNTYNMSYTNYDKSESLTVKAVNIDGIWYYG
jgi:hypothetical protein